jgi:hypothetical protein
MCSDLFDNSTACVNMPRKPRSAEDSLSALPPSLRKHFLESVDYNRELLEDLASM